MVESITSSVATEAMLSDNDCDWELVSDLDSVVSLESTTSSINNAAQHPKFYVNVFVRTSVPIQERQTTSDVHSTQPNHKAQHTTYLDALLGNNIAFPEMPKTKKPFQMENSPRKIPQDCALENDEADTSLLEKPCASLASFKGHRQSHTMRRIPNLFNDNRRYEDAASSNERMMDKDLWWKSRASRLEQHWLRRQDRRAGRHARLESTRMIQDEEK